jgi:translation initiation factor RLI1
MTRRMTAKQLANLRPPKKGEVRNPQGINNPIKQKINRLTQFELQQIGSTMLNKDRVELRKIIKAKSGYSVNQQIFAALALKSLEQADEKCATVVWDRTAGKVSEKIQMFGPDDDPSKADALTPEEKEKILNDNIKKLDITGGE